MLMPLKIAVKITAVSVLASKEGACGFLFLFSLCDRTASNCLCEAGAGWWESAPSEQDRDPTVGPWLALGVLQRWVGVVFACL